ncbi:hypothetical protein K469DRAFT_689630 [Zopfia rhizophila CBS 207.26]|uniref:Chromo domain-containing protein n=1 Tax=Zopfia rhizophila CBS 207.26 TaxID=1314779 RepID=A0A6A6E147_9PEZI|nr:hypothetical protein K469DRAFT_689630 [Zopfia rhizophila CBS 207.26]
MDKHIEELENRERRGGRIVTCPYPGPRCLKSFYSVLHLRFYLEDIYGIPMGKELKAKKVASERILPSKKQYTVKKERSESCLFINNTVITMRTSSWRILKTLSGSTTPSYPLKSSTWSKKEWSGSETLPLSGSSDAKDDLASDLDFVVIDKPDIDFVIVNKLDIRSDSSNGYDTPLPCAFSEDLINQAIPPLNDLDLGAIEVVDLTDSNEVPQRNTYISEASKNCAGVSIAIIKGQPAKGLIDLEDNQWEVEELQGRRKVGRGFQYFVKWVGFPESENT